MEQSRVGRLTLRAFIIAVVALVVIVSVPVVAQEGTEEVALPNIVLVHGAWADGSSWSAVIERLQAAGYHVVAPQFPHASLAGDVAILRHVLSLQTGPTIVAGHSFGGQIMTAL